MLRKIFLIPVYRKPTQFLKFAAARSTSVWRSSTSTLFHSHSKTITISKSKTMRMTVSMSTKAELCIESPTTLADEKIDITVKGLSPKQKVTLHASIVDESNKVFVSHAFYQSNEAGEVLVSSQPSTGGSYTGIEPMGLLWSAQGVPGLKKGSTITKKDVMEPLRYGLSVFDDHVDPSQSSDQENADLKLLVSSSIERLYCKPGVRRIVVREGRIRGVLFLPTGNGPFPGIIELKGSAGGLYEQKAALLASHGFAALALAYFGYDDLPRDLTTLVLDVDYFDEAADWLLRHPQVNANLGLGLVGISLGAQMAMHLAALRKDVKAVVNISAPQVNVLFPVNIKGKLSKCQAINPELVKIEDGAMSLRECFHPVPIDQEVSEGRIPVENIEAPLLLLCGAGDKNMLQPEYAWKIQETMEKHGKGSLCSVVVYPDAGHVIDVPYIPNIPLVFHGQYKVYIAYGGEARPHAHAQVDSWLKTLQFFQKNLVGLQNSHL